MKRIALLWMVMVLAVSSFGCARKEDESTQVIETPSAGSGESTEQVIEESEEIEEEVPQTKLELLSESEVPEE